MLFPLAPSDAAQDKLTSLIASIKEATTRLSESAATRTSQLNSASNKAKELPDVERLQAVIDKLRSELGK